MNNKFIKNTSWILAGDVVKMVIAFIVNIMTVRYLGPSNFGIINYVGSYISFFTSIIGFGLSGIIIYEFVSKKDNDGTILGTAIVLRFVVSIVCFIGLIAVIYATDGSESTILYVALIQGIQLPFLCLDTINYFYQYKLLSKYSVLVQVIAYILIGALKVYLLISGKNVFWFAFSISVNAALLGVLYMISFINTQKIKLGFSFTVVKRLLKGCWPFILANIMVVIYGQTDKVMIKHMLASNEKVGLYSAAIVICGLIGVLPQAILDSARPIIMQIKKQNEQLYNVRVKQLSAAIIWISILYSLFITLFSRLVITVLYGEAYISANSCLRIAVWYTAFSFLGAVRDLWLICEGKNQYVFILSAMGSLSNVALNFFLIPIYGINGAAVATLLTQVLTNFIYPAFFRKTRKYTKTVASAFVLKDCVSYADLKKYIYLVRAKLPHKNSSK